MADGVSKKKKTRNYGHKKGIETVEKIISAAIQKKIKYLTLFVFSTENWRRPVEEVNYLFSLLNSFEAKNFEEETPVNIIIRHEGIKLIDKVDHTLPKAKVLETRLLGRFSLVHLQVEKGNSKVHLLARVPGLSYLKPQTKIGIEVDSVQSYIFPV